MRADIFLYTNGFAKSRTHASELIKSGVLLDGKKIAKPSYDIPDNTKRENHQRWHEGIFGSDEGGTDSFRAGYCDIWAGKR